MRLSIPSACENYVKIIIYLSLMEKTRIEIDEKIYELYRFKVALLPALKV